MTGGTEIPSDESANSEIYLVSLSGEGIQIDREVGRQTALAIVQLLLSGTASQGTEQRDAGANAAFAQGSDPDRGAPASPLNGRPEVSVGEFIAEVEADRNVDKIAAIAVWLKRFQSKEAFGRHEIRDQFQHAGEPMPGNFSRDFRWAVSNKWISSPGGEDIYYVTSTGEEAVDSHFSEEILEKTRQPASRSRGDSSADDD